MPDRRGFLGAVAGLAAGAVPAPKRLPNAPLPMEWVHSTVSFNLSGEQTRAVTDLIKSLADRGLVSEGMPFSAPDA